MKRNMFAGAVLTAFALVVPLDLAAQDRQISGTVTRAETGTPIVAAEVTTSPGYAPTVTGPDGRFTITAPAGEARLQVHALGYARVDIVVPANQSTVNISLDADPFQLDAVVVTGQATTVERRSATTSIGYVSSDELSEVPAPSVLDALTGKITGVNIQSNSGAPGGGSQMQIRGNATILGAHDPLYVVDGVIYSNASIPSGRGFANAAAAPSLEADAVNRIADLNPEDIASVEVLKGAAASSIYGSKASNGVVVITTRRGRAGQARVNVKQRLGLTTPLNLLETRRWTRAEALETFDDFADEVEPFFDDDGSPYFDHYETVFGNRRLSHETVVDVSGGAESTRYFISATSKREEGIEIGTGASRQGVRINVDQMLSPTLDLRISSVFNRAEHDRGWNTNCNNFGCHGYAIAYIPSFIDLTATNPDGTFLEPPSFSVPSNPLQLTELGVNHEETNRFTGGATVGWSAYTAGAHDLRLVAAGGVDAFDQRNDVWTPNELFFERVQALPGESIESGGRSLFWNWNLNALHAWTGSGWSANTSAGLQYEDRRLGTNLIRSQNLLPGERNVNQGTNVTATENLTRERTLALYGQESLRVLDERLLLQAGLRAERSSVNGDIDRFFVFPNASASYRLIDLIGEGSEVKLRAAYGETGNQPLFGQKFTTLFTPQLGGEQGITVAPASGFADVEPERLKEIEAGIDGFIMDGRLNWEITGFNRNTTNLLLQRVPPPSSGFATQVFNGGRIRNSGIELALGYAPLQTAESSWLMRGTFTRYTSEVEDLAGLPSFFPPGSGFGNLGRTFIQEGRPITQIVGFDFADDGTRADSITQLGNSAPDFRVGFFNDVTVGAFDARFVVDWQHGGDVINLTQFLHDDGQTSPDWGTPAWEARYQGYLTGAISPYIEDGSFVKLREVSLGMQLPAGVAGWMGASDARIGLTGRNLFTWTDYSGLDPEVSNFGSLAVRNNLDISPYPPARSFYLDISVGF